MLQSPDSLPSIAPYMASPTRTSVSSSARAPTDTLNFGECDWLGFDLDHTLVRYRLERTNALVFKCLCDFLVGKGYSPEIQTRGYVEHLPYKGLVFDNVLGNFLVLSATGKILKASHGTKALTESDIAKAYSGDAAAVCSSSFSSSSSSTQSTPASANEAAAHAASGHSPASAGANAGGSGVSLPQVAQALLKGEKLHRFHPFTTFFDMPGIAVLAHFVDVEDETYEKQLREYEQQQQKQGQTEMQEKEGSDKTTVPSSSKASNSSLTAAAAPSPPLYRRIALDLLHAFNNCFDAANFRKGTGGFFSTMIADTERYVHRITPKVRAWLHALKARGVRLFLLTNSHIDYANMILNFAYGPTWRELFELVMVVGQKPDFFTKRGSDAIPFLHVNHDHTLGEKVASCSALELGAAIAKGNHEDLAHFLVRHSRLAVTPTTPEPESVRGEIGVDVLPSSTQGELAQAMAIITEEAAAETGHGGENSDSVPAKRSRVGATDGAASTKTRAGGEPLRVAYFGDHPVGDVAAVAMRTSWHAVAILEEMLTSRLPHGEEGDVKRIDEEAVRALSPSAAFWGAYLHWDKNVQATEDAAPCTTTAAADSATTTTSPPTPTKTVCGVEPTLFEQLLFDHSSFIVPHLDAIAARPLDHKFRVVAPHDPRLGLHYHY